MLILKSYNIMSSTSGHKWIRSSHYTYYSDTSLIKLVSVYIEL